MLLSADQDLRSTSFVALSPVRLGGALGVLVAFLIVGTGCGVIGSEGDTTPPPVPSELTANSGNEQIALQWSAVDAEDLDGYNIYRSTSSLPSDSVSSLSPVNENPVADPSFIDETVENGTVYAYRVTGVDEAGNESNPSGETTVRPFSGPPDRP